MVKKFLLTVGVLFGVLVLALGAAFWFRDSLARYGAERLLAERQITLSSLSGLQFNSRSAAVDELELLLQSSGQRLLISGLDVDYSFPNGLSAPVVESITIASAQLLREPDSAEGQSSSGPGASADASNTLSLSDLLLLFREFPLARVMIDELRVPQRQETLALNLTHTPGQLSVQVDSGALRLLADFAQADAAATAQFQIGLTRNDEAVGAFAMTLQPNGPAFVLAGAGRLQFTDLNTLLGELEQAPLPIPLRAANLNFELAGPVADDVLGSTYPLTFVVGMQSGSNLVLAEGLAEGLGELTVNFSEKAELSISTGVGAGVSIGSLPLQVGGTWQEQPFNVDTRLGIDDCRLAIEAACRVRFDGTANFAEYTLAGAIQVSAPNLGTGNGASGEYQVSTEALLLGGLPAWLPVFDVDASVALDGDVLTFSTPLLLRNAPADAGLAIEGRHDLAAGAGNARVTIQNLEFMEEGQSLSAWFPEWSQPFDLLTGSATADVDLVWQTGVEPVALTASVTGALNDVGGFYGDYFFRGVSGAVEADIDTAAEFLVNTPPLALTMAAIDVGVPMENLSLNFQVERATQRILIESFSMDLVGGTVTGMDITYDFNLERNPILVTFSGLRLDQMLDLVEYEGIEATGAVSGEIPLTLTANGVEVEAGALRADAPGGVIKYLQSVGAAGNPGIDLVNQALSNYQFDTLTSGIEYKPDGELLLSMQLQGSNPNMSGGQRVNLNLNLSDNIPALLESLQAARAIEDFLAEQYQ